MQGIYLIRCKSENKVYIGQSKNIKRRYSQHISLLSRNKHANCHLQRAFNTFGIKDFCFEVLYEVQNSDLTPSQLDSLEKYYIRFYHSTNRQKGYNLEDGGKVNSKMSEETKKKLSIAMTGKKGFAYWKGKKMSQELRDKLSRIRKGKPSHWKGKKQSKQHIQKRIATQLGKVWVNNGIESRFVSQEDAKVLLNKGFVLGRPFFSRVKGKKYLYLGEMLTISQISKICGIGRSVLDYRLKNGWGMEKATTTPIKK